MTEAFAAILAILIPAAAIPAIGYSSRWPNLRESWTLTASVITFVLVASLIPGALDGKTESITLLNIVPGLGLSLRADPLAVLFAATASFLWILTSAYSIGYMRANREAGQTRYYCFFAAAMTATLGIAFSGNLFTLFFFYEALTLCTYPLVNHHRSTESSRAGRRYLTYLLGTSLGFFLAGIFLTYHLSGSLSFTEGGVLTASVSGPLVMLTFFLFIAGTTKAALIPLHSWLPAAMVAPTPVSALLHAVAVVKAGVFTILRITLDVFGVDLLQTVGLGSVLGGIASVTILAASIVALRQDSLKLRLAYSTISQLAYIVLGAALLTPGGVKGSAFQIVAHAFGKITLFFCAGAIYAAQHKTKVSELDGIGQRMPWTMSAFAVGSLSMIGIPLTGGFLAKWYLVIGAVEADQMIAVSVIMASTILNAGYFLPIVYAAFLKEPSAGEPGGKGEAPLWMLIPLLLTALGTVLLFFFPNGPLALIDRIVDQSVTGGG